MDLFLATALNKMNAFPSDDLHILRQSFDRSMEINNLLFGKHAFRKSLAEDDADADRNILNISLFDVCSVLLGDPKGRHKTEPAVGNQSEEGNYWFVGRRGILVLYNLLNE